MVARYRLTSTWHVPAAAETVWGTLWDVEGWPGWWPQFATARLVREGDDGGVGRRTHLVVRSPLGYQLSFGVEVTAISAPRLVVARVVGQLSGTGSWVLTEGPGGVRTDITWDVAVRGWMHALSPVAAPVFRWAHGAVMAAGERGLTRLIAAPGSDPRRVPPPRRSGGSRRP